MLQQISHVSWKQFWRYTFCGRLGLSHTDTHDKHTSCFSQQLLHIRDHKHTAKRNREMLFALDWADFHRLDSFLEWFLRANRLNYKRPSFILDRRQVWLVYLSDACCIVDDESIKPVTTAFAALTRVTLYRGHHHQLCSSIDYVSAETSSSQIGRQEER